MSHPLQDVMRDADGFVLIGDSETGHFPAQSYHCYASVDKPFHCLDLGGLTASRGATEGGVVHPSVEDLPADHGDLAIVWVHPHTAVRAVEAAHAAGCRRVWFSFGAGHRDGVARARELGLEVVEIGRCPVYYLDRMTPACKAHAVVTKLTGTWRRSPQTDSGAKRRELW